MRSLLFLLTISFGIGFMTSCKNSSKSDIPKEERIEYASTYVCPMHCEGSGSEEPGKCPTCGMDYVLNEDKPTTSMDENHEGHDHEMMDEENATDDHEGHNH